MTIENREKSETSNSADKIKLFKTAKMMISNHVLLKTPMRLSGWPVKRWRMFYVNKCEMKHAGKSSACSACKIVGFELTKPLQSKILGLY